MFSKEVYIGRRENLRSLVKNGLLFFPGNFDQPYNYRSNTYRFRQDSSFSYFFGLNEPGVAGLIDLDEGREIIFGDNIDMEDIIWMGFLPSIEERASKAGIKDVQPISALRAYIDKALERGRTVRFLPPYHGDVRILLSDLLHVPVKQIDTMASGELVHAVIRLRSVKGPEEIAEIEHMVDVAGIMHTTAMRMAKPGVKEAEIAAAIEGIALAHGNGVSFPVILSMNGEILHNHGHHQILEKQRLMVTDAGSESDLLYASDITRTVPVGGKFSAQQKDIYQLVYDANINTLQKSGPETTYLDIHLQAARIIASGLCDLGLMKGNVDDAVSAGAHALFFPHGLGHMLGMDVHDMEGYGEDFVGYNDSIQRSSQFGLAYLRFAKKPEPGYVLTDEPGIYFIPALIDLWKKEKKFTDFINYDKVEEYRNFGGIRIEDDLLITENGCRLLGKPIPKSIAEIEELMSGG